MSTGTFCSGYGSFCSCCGTVYMGRSYFSNEPGTGRQVSTLAELFLVGRVHSLRVQSGVLCNATQFGHNPNPLWPQACWCESPSQSRVPSDYNYSQMVTDVLQGEVLQQAYSTALYDPYARVFPKSQPLYDPYARVFPKSLPRTGHTRACSRVSRVCVPAPIGFFLPGESAAESCHSKRCSHQKGERRVWVWRRGKNGGRPAQCHCYGTCLRGERSSFNRVRSLRSGLARVRAQSYAFCICRRCWWCGADCVRGNGCCAIEKAVHGRCVRRTAAAAHLHRGLYGSSLQIAWCSGQDRFPLFVFMGVGTLVALGAMLKLKPKKKKEKA